MLESLEARGLDVEVLPWEAARPGVLRDAARRATPRGRHGHDWAASGDHARAVRKHLRAHPVDVVLAVAASTQSARLRLRNVPLVGSSDTTFRALRSMYEAFSSLTPAAVRQGERLDRASVRAAEALIYPSRWAAERAVEHCGADPALITIAPYGPNLSLPTTVAARQAPHETPVILFVGASWSRKGGDVVTATAARLRAEGVALRLVCVGAEPPPEVAAEVDEHYRIDKNVPAEMAQLVNLFLAADVLLLPTRADTFGIVLSEAAALGLPAVAHGIGAIPEIVLDGATGRVLPPDASLADWVSAVREVLTPSAYSSMSAAARARFDEDLSWERWAESVEERLRGAVMTFAERRRRP